ncbi:hypothetical protein MNBD_BACTEROID05-878 [hydrothermal vent metagenome]|uniref:Oxidoreductase component of anaerobic dehydrogenases Chaperone protein TorD n=1 Tax=hydrothermal vent metagenome TaxID=652676 RepID=A0A3B0TK12_9ZZZZ
MKYFRSPEILESLESTGVCLNTSDLDQSQLSKLQEDYTQLFIGPRKHISLNESIYTENTPQFWGESAVKIKKLIDYIGLELDKNWKQMPDHISVEFELMQKLLEAKDDALKNNDSLTAEQCSSAITHLHNEHIIKWVPQVCDQVVEKAQTSVYRAIGMWIKTFIQFS